MLSALYLAFQRYHDPGIGVAVPLEVDAQIANGMAGGSLGKSVELMASELDGEVVGGGQEREDDGEDLVWEREERHVF